MNITVLASITAIAQTTIKVVSSRFANTTVKLGENGFSSTTIGAPAYGKVHGLICRYNVYKALFRLLSILVVVYTCSFMHAATTSEVFNEVGASLAIIKSNRASGSGFVALLNDKKYLVTNEHVLRGGKPDIYLLNGKKISWNKIEVSDNQDLIRLEITDLTIPALNTATDQPSMDEQIYVFGNSDGRGVVTSLEGMVMGIGPYELEINATFVQGNSGSPIINKDGYVLGVATYASLHIEPDNWLKQGTRFTEVRRFGVRLNQLKWNTLTWEEYELRADTLVDLETYCVDTYKLIKTGEFIDTQKGYTRLIYNYYSNEKKYRRHTFLCQNLSDLATSYNNCSLKYAESRMHEHNRRNYSSIQNMHDADSALFFSSSQAREGYKIYDNAFRQIYTKPAPMIIRSDWKSQRLRNEAMQWLEIIKYLAGKIDRDNH